MGRTRPGARPSLAALVAGRRCSPSCRRRRALADDAAADRRPGGAHPDLPLSRAARRRAARPTAARSAARSWTPAASSSPTALRRCPPGSPRTAGWWPTPAPATVLAARDPHGRYYPASTLKTLTLLTLLPRAGPGAGRDGTAEDETIEGSRVGMVAGGRYSGRHCSSRRWCCSRATTRPTRWPGPRAASRRRSRR